MSQSVRGVGADPPLSVEPQTDGEGSIQMARPSRDGTDSTE